METVEFFLIKKKKFPLRAFKICYANALMASVLITTSWANLLLCILSRFGFSLTFFEAIAVPVTESTIFFFEKRTPVSPSFTTFSIIRVQQSAITTQMDNSLKLPFRLDAFPKKIGVIRSSSTSLRTKQMIRCRKKYHANWNGNHLVIGSLTWQLIVIFFLWTKLLISGKINSDLDLQNS